MQFPPASSYVLCSDILLNFVYKYLQRVFFALVERPHFTSVNYVNDTTANGIYLNGFTCMYNRQVLVGS
jgi:hypothetical protein